MSNKAIKECLNDYSSAYFQEPWSNLTIKEKRHLKSVVIKHILDWEDEWKGVGKL